MIAETLSPLQYVLLNEIVKKGGLTEDEAADYKQNTFGSFIRRKYLAYNRHEKYLSPTDAARAALTQYREADIRRHVESSLLSIWFYRRNRLTPPQPIRRPAPAQLRDVKQHKRAS